MHWNIAQHGIWTELKKLAELISNKSTIDNLAMKCMGIKQGDLELKEKLKNDQRAGSWFAATVMWHCWPEVR